MSYSGLGMMVMRQERTRHHTLIKHSKWERGQKYGGKDTGDAIDKKRAQRVRIINILVVLDLFVLPAISSHPPFSFFFFDRTFP